MSRKIFALAAIMFVLMSASGSRVLHAQSTGRLRLPVIDAVVDSGLSRVSLTVKLVSDNPNDTTVAAALVQWRAGRWTDAQGTALTELTTPLGHVKDITNPALKYKLSYSVMWKLGRTDSVLKATAYAAVREGASMVVGAPFPGVRNLYVVTWPTIVSDPAERVERVDLTSIIPRSDGGQLRLYQSIPQLTSQGGNDWTLMTRTTSSDNGVRTAISIRLDSAEVARSKNPRLELQYSIRMKGQSTFQQRVQVIPLPLGRSAVLKAPPVPVPE